MVRFEVLPRILLAWSLGCIGWAATAHADVPLFKKIVLTDKYYCDGIDAGDINRDGQLDIVAGPFWYEGPDFQTAHEFYPAVELPREPSPSNSMFSFVYDFSGDQWPDILVLGRVHKHEAYWYENPGQDSTELWKKHFAFERVRGESPTLVDIDGDGIPQLICHWDGKWGWAEFDPAEPRKPWRFRAIDESRDWNEFYHGTGVGDINGDSRLDLIIQHGWYEQPDAATELWPFHEGHFSKERGGAQMYAYDVDFDGDNDVISSLHAHEWGLAWFEQIQVDGRITFTEHKMMGDRSEEEVYGVAFSQPHALEIADIDGDGINDIVTGKRMWAHGPTGDVEPNEAPVLYWFQHTKPRGEPVRFVPHQIDDSSGVGVQVKVIDLNLDGRQDILTVSKLGSFVFINERQALDK